MKEKRGKQNKTQAFTASMAVEKGAASVSAPKDAPLKSKIERLPTQK